MSVADVLSRIVPYVWSVLAFKVSEVTLVAVTLPKVQVTLVADIVVPEANDQLHPVDADPTPKEVLIDRAVA